MLSRLGRGQKSKGSDDNPTSRSSTSRSTSSRPAAAKPRAPAAATALAPDFSGKIVQHPVLGWQLQGFDADLRAVMERLQPLQHRLTTAVRAEQAEQEKALRQLYATSSLARLKQDGVLLYPLRATPHGVELGQMIWRLAAADGREFRSHKFKAGDSVLIRRHVAGGGAVSGGAGGGGGGGGGPLRLTQPNAAQSPTHAPPSAPRPSTTHRSRPIASHPAAARPPPTRPMVTMMKQQTRTSPRQTEAATATATATATAAAMRGQCASRRRCRKCRRRLYWWRWIGETVIAWR